MFWFEIIPLPLPENPFLPSLFRNFLTLEFPKLKISLSAKICQYFLKEVGVGGGREW